MPLFDVLKDYECLTSKVEKGSDKVAITISDEVLDWFCKLRKMMENNKG